MQDDSILAAVFRPVFRLPDHDLVFRKDNGALVVNVREELHVTWALLRMEGDDLYSVVAHGSGPSGSLREPRHTYFGEDGYVFYVNPAILTWGFKQLERWFDFS